MKTIDCELELKLHSVGKAAWNNQSIVGPKFATLQNRGHTKLQKRGHTKLQKKGHSKLQNGLAIANVCTMGLLKHVQSLFLAALPWSTVGSLASSPRGTSTPPSQNSWRRILPSRAGGWVGASHRSHRLQTNSINETFDSVSPLSLSIWELPLPARSWTYSLNLLLHSSVFLILSFVFSILCENMVIRQAWYEGLELWPWKHSLLPNFSTYTANGRLPTMWRSNMIYLTLSYLATNACYCDGA